MGQGIARRGETPGENGRCVADLELLKGWTLGIFNLGTCIIVEMKFCRRTKLFVISSN